MVLINCIDSCMTASAVFVDHQHFCTKRGGTPIQYSQQLLWDEVRIIILETTAERTVVKSN